MDSVSAEGLNVLRTEIEMASGSSGTAFGVRILKFCANITNVYYYYYYVYY
jgi:hypothetical protein